MSCHMDIWGTQNGATASKPVHNGSLCLKNIQGREKKAQTISHGGTRERIRRDLFLSIGKVKQKNKKNPEDRSSWGQPT